jgi:serine/threonine-protein kinase haspin
MALTEKDCYDCLVEVEKVLGRSVEAVKPKALKVKGRRKTQASITEGKNAIDMGPQSASEVVGYALKRAWLL